MTGILEFLSSDSMVRLGWALVHSVWQVALLALLMAAILAALRGRSADLRYACACTGLVAMLLLPVVTLFLVQGREGVGLRHVEVCTAIFTPRRIQPHFRVRRRQSIPWRSSGRQEPATAIRSRLPSCSGLPRRPASS